MSELNDVAGSEEVILVVNETQDTLTELSYRPKQNLQKVEKPATVEQAKENRDPSDEVEEMQTESVEQNNSSAVNGTISSNQTQTLTDGSMSTDEPEKKEENQSTQNNQPQDSTNNNLETTTSAANLRLYISPSTSLLETTNVDDTVNNTESAATVESVPKPSEDTMDTNDAQISLGSGEGDAVSAVISETSIVNSNNPATEISNNESEQKKTIMSPLSKAAYSLSQPAHDKLDALLAKLTKSPKNADNHAKNSKDETPTDDKITIRQEEEFLIKETVSKILRRYVVKVDHEGRTIARDLLDERVVEENTTTRLESWPPAETKTRRTATKTTRTNEVTQKKANKTQSTQRRTKSLKPTSTPKSTVKPKVIVISDDETNKKKPNKKSSDSEDDDDDDDDEQNKDNDEDEDDDVGNGVKEKNTGSKKVEAKKKSTNDDEDDKNNKPNDNGNDDDEEEEDDDDDVSDDVDGEEFIPPVRDPSDVSLSKGSRIFARWSDGHYYPGTILNVSGDKCMVEFDDGAKRSVKSTFIIPHHYLPINQSVMAQTQNDYFDRGTVKRLVKKSKSNTLGYVIEKDGKEKWYPLRLISLTQDQAEGLLGPTKTNEESNPVIQGKRKRASALPQSPNKKSKTSTISSPATNPRTTFTPTRQTKLFNSMYFLLTGFNDMMERRHEIEDSIESHGGKVIEKMPPANRRDRVYLISDVARKTAKFFEAKKLNVPCISYKWIESSVERSQLQDLETYKLVLPEKEKAATNDEEMHDAQKEESNK